MIKNLFIFIFGAIIGGAVGGGAVLFYYPFWFPPAEVNEKVTDIASKALIGKGTFIHPDPSDTVHWGKGSLSVYQSGSTTEFQLEADFQVGPGPDYHIYLIEKQNITDKSQFDPDSANELSRLKSFTGSQVYSVDGNGMLENHAIVVWCKMFRQLITVADIKGN